MTTMRYPKLRKGTLASDALLMDFVLCFSSILRVDSRFLD